MMQLFKDGWEQVHLPINITDEAIKHTVEQVLETPVLSLNRISIGYGNANWCVQVENSRVLFRIFSKKPAAISIEQSIFGRLKSIVACPTTLAQGEIEGFSYRIQCFLPGENFRSILLATKDKLPTKAIHHAGQVLANIHSVHTEEQGFFEEGMQVRPFEDSAPLAYFYHTLLEECHTKSVFDVKVLAKLKALQSAPALKIPPQNICLVHGDFDPSNLLVDHDMISAVLDWEYTFSGTPEVDIANFLRYAHRLPKSYERAFLDGYTLAGGILHPQYKELVRFNNLVSLMDLGIRKSSTASPKAWEDISALVQYFLDDYR